MNIIFVEFETWMISPKLSIVFYIYFTNQLVVVTYTHKLLYLQNYIS